jgi:O-antigen/teichoic acid export membrane protein
MLLSRAFHSDIGEISPSSHFSAVHKVNSVRHNSAWLMFSRLTAQGLAILFIAITARRLGVESFGQFTLFSAVVLIGNTFTNFGTDTYLIREIARAEKVTPILSGTFGLQLLLSALWVIVTILLHQNSALLLYSFSLFPLTLFSIATATLRAFERMDLVWALSLANGLLQVLAAFFSFDLWTLCFFLLCGGLFIAALSYWSCSAFIPNFRLFPITDIFSLLKLTLPFATLTILMVVSQRIGVLTVSALLGDAATAIFSSVTRVVDGLKFGHYAVLGALLPVISRGTQTAKQSFQKSFAALLSLSFCMALLLYLFPRLIILILYGADFSSAIPMLSYLGLSLIPYTISSFISYDLIARGKEKALVKATVISLILFLALYLGLTLMHNLNGAIYAALLGETLQAATFIYFQRRIAVTLPFQVGTNTE